MTKRRIVGALVGVVATGVLATGCTPHQIQQWAAWHQKDPAAAEAFARRPDVQSQLRASGTSSRVQTTTRSTRSTATVLTGASGVNWDAVARCESGGQWNHGLVTNHVGTFSGGLMIMQSAWRQFGGTQFASYAGGASRAEQIIVAERIAARVGAARAWQCPTPHL
jgi:hypothetical protein